MGYAGVHGHAHRSLRAPGGGRTLILTLTLTLTLALTLALTLTLTLTQVAEGVPLMAVLEDDVALGRDFPEHIGRLAAMHLLGNGTGSLLRRKARRRQQAPADLVQLGACTEGYREHGLLGCVD